MAGGELSLRDMPDVRGLAETLHVPDPAYEPVLVVGNPDHAEDGELRLGGRERFDQALTRAHLIHLGRGKPEPVGQHALRVERLDAGDPGTYPQDDGPGDEDCDPGSAHHGLLEERASGARRPGTLHRHADRS